MVDEWRERLSSFTFPQSLVHVVRHHHPPALARILRRHHEAALWKTRKPLSARDGGVENQRAALGSKEEREDWACLIVLMVCPTRQDN